MTTQVYTSAIAHANDIDFRAWGSELSDEMTAVGFPKSTDTGQIDWLTVTRAAINTAAGYEIRYLNDSLHATKPCYVKIEYATNSTATNPQLWITVGSGTDGAGTITGVMLTRQSLIPNTALQVGTFPTYICVLEGYFSFAFKRRAQSSNNGTCFFALCRTVDTSGTPTSTGFNFYFTPATNALNRKTYITTEVNEVTQFCHIPGNISATSLVSGSAQVFRHFAGQPISRCVPFILTFIEGEIGDESTFPATPIGVTSRTYLALSGTGNPVAASANGLNTHRLAIQFE